MEAITPSRLTLLRPRIKKRWTELLRAEPVATPLAHPDALVFLMDETLAQLTTIGSGQSLKHWLADNPALLAPLRSQCQCSLNPLLSYYSTGNQALREIAKKPLGDDLDEVLLYFHGLAQQDIEALCGVCCRKGTDTCSQTQIALEETQHARFLGR